MTEVEAIETSKKCQIRDILNNLRYTVYMSGTDDPDSPSNLSFKITVVNNFMNISPTEIAVKPGDKEAPIYYYSEALGIYNDYVRSYTNLVKAMTRDFQDIDIYKDKIDYSLEKPHCCATCHWSKRRNSPEDDFTFGSSGKLECWNLKCCQDYGFNPYSDARSDARGSHILGEEPTPQQIEEERKLLALKPQVDPFGLCKFYEEKEIHYEPVFGDSLGAIVDRRVAKTAAPQVSTIASAIVSASISSIVSASILDQTSAVISASLTTIIGPAIEYQLENNLCAINGNRDLDTQILNGGKA